MQPVDFIVDSLLEPQNICNLEHEKAELERCLDGGQNLVIYGRRNMGKTSLIKNVALKSFQKRHKSAVTLFVDLLGVHSVKEIIQRLNGGLKLALADAFPKETAFREALSAVKALRPNVSVDPLTGGLSFGIGLSFESPETIGEVFRGISSLADTKKIAIVLDEFQDICSVPGADALFRDCFQNLPSTIPIFLSGSKKHLLAQLVTPHRAPLASFGSDLEFRPIDYKKYHEYMNVRFGSVGSSITYENALYLQDLMQRIPEAINIVCNRLKLISNTQYNIQDINNALVAELSSRQSRLERYLSRFSEAEVQVLTAIAKNTPVKHPMSKAFYSKTGLTPSGVKKIINGLEDMAEVYQEESGYVIADPIIEHYLVRYR